MFCYFLAMLRQMGGSLFFRALIFEYLCLAFCIIDEQGVVVIYMKCLCFFRSVKLLDLGGDFSQKRCDILRHVATNF
jgi:hypothetical protein